MKYFRIFTLIIILIPMLELKSQNYKTLRENMVKLQIKARGVNDKEVLSAMLKVERHKFVSKYYLDRAYEDTPLPIGNGQTISQPFIVAYMTDLLDLTKKEKVLEIGTGSGYQAAVLAEVAGAVYTIELIKSLGENANKILKELAYTNIYTKIGDGYQGWKEHAPFDAIIVTCAPTHIPEELKSQLAEGGIMVIPVGQRIAQELVVLRKKDGKLKQKDVIGVRFVPMKDGKGKKY